MNGLMRVGRSPTTDHPRLEDASPPRMMRAATVPTIQPLSQVEQEAIDRYLASNRLDLALEAADGALQGPLTDSLIFSCFRVYKRVETWLTILEVCERSLRNVKPDLQYRILIFNHAIEAAEKLKKWSKALQLVQGAQRLKGIPSLTFYRYSYEALRFTLQQELPKRLPTDFNSQKLQNALALAESSPREAIAILEELLQGTHETLPLRADELVDAKLAYARLLIAERDPNAEQALQQVGHCHLNPPRIVEYQRLKSRLAIQKGERIEARGHFAQGIEACRQNEVHRAQNASFVKEFLTFIRDIAEKQSVFEKIRSLLSTAQQIEWEIELYRDDPLRVTRVKEACLQWLSRFDTKTSDKRLQILYLTAELSEDLEKHRWLTEAHRIDPTWYQDKSPDELLALAQRQKDPEKRLKILEQVGALDLEWTLVQAECHRQIGTAEHLSQARNILNAAYALIPPLTFWPSTQEKDRRRIRQSRVTCQLAKLALSEEKFEEAGRLFCKAFTRFRRTSGARSYFEFLRQQKRFSDALNVCAKAKQWQLFQDEDCHYYRAVIFLDQKQYREAVEECTTYLRSAQSATGRQRRVHEIAFESLMQLERFQEAAFQALLLYRRDPLASWDKLLLAYTECITQQHLNQLLDALENKNLNSLQRQEHRASFRDTYAKELERHRTIAARLQPRGNP